MEMKEVLYLLDLLVLRVLERWLLLLAGEAVEG